MARSTTHGYWRQRAGATPVPLVACLTLTFGAADDAENPTGKYLPKGAQVLEVIYNGAGTGGSDPTFDMGYVGGDADALVAEGDADGGAARVLLAAAPLAAKTEITAGQGDSAATGGTVTAHILYVMEDDGSE